MMKQLLGLLACWILIISVIPCADHVIPLEHESACHHADAPADDDHDQNMDFCSPFCSCDCCSTLTQTIWKSIQNVNQQVTSIIAAKRTFNRLDLIHNHWQPPKT